jgi:hypothetical protein
MSTIIYTATPSATLVNIADHMGIFYLGRQKLPPTFIHTLA